MALEGIFGDAMPSRVLMFSTTRRTLTLPSGRVVETAAYETLSALTAPPALILHFAFRTKGCANEPGYVEANRAISAVMQTYIRRNGARGLFVPSSGAVYGPDRQPHQDLAGDPYGALKYEDEQIFQALAAQLGFPAVVMRIFNLAGPGINNLTGYALSSIISDILRGGPITLHAARPVWRSYVHVGDVLNIALSLLLQGASPAVFDTAGERPVEIGELATLAARLMVGVEPHIIRPHGWAQASPNRYLGNGTAFSALAAQQGIALAPLERQIVDTVEYMRTSGPA
jgi:nucleoside-diphosphate-sugar epimerase